MDVKDPKRAIGWMRKLIKKKAAGCYDLLVHKNRPAGTTKQAHRAHDRTSFKDYPDYRKEKSRS